MDLLSGITGAIVPFLVILTALVFVHEMGHFLVARRYGVRVEVFSVGFGPELWGRTSRTGTRWKIAAIPLGGYVKMFGDADAASAGAPDTGGMTEQERRVSFPHRPLGQRAAIVAAGPAANFAFAILLLAGLYSFIGQPYTPATVDAVSPGSAAETAGLRPGDLILSIDGRSIDRFEDLQRIVRDRPGERLALLVEREGERLELIAVPALRELTDRFGNKHRIGLIGVRNSQVQTVRRDPLSALWHATLETVSISGQTLRAVGQIIIGARGSDDLGGPLRIAQMSGDVVRGGVYSTIWFTALLSINLGLINLFPIPVLDGGHLFLYAAEAVRGRPLGRRFQDYAAMTGLALVIGLMLFVTWNDLVNMRVVDYIGGLFG